jgi:hypothetical protein
MWNQVYGILALVFLYYFNEFGVSLVGLYVLRSIFLVSKPHDLVYLCPPMGGVLVLSGFALIYGVVQKYATEDVLRDVYYMLSFIVIFLYGSMLSVHKGLVRVVKIAFYVMLIRYSITLFNLLSNFSSDIVDVSEMRDDIGQTTSLSAILIISLYGFIGPFQRFVFTAIVLGNLLSFSRSGVITLMYFGLRAKGLTKIILVLIAPIILMCVALYLSSSPLLESFVLKMERSVDEVSDLTFQSDYEIHERWRAFEVSIVFEEISRSEVYDILMGGGFGKAVGISFNKRGDRMSEEYINDIPVFHNAALYVLLKMGVLGLIAWLIMWGRIFFRIRQFCYVLKNELGGRTMLLAFLAVVAISSYLYGYPFMKNAGVETFLIGALYGVTNIARDGWKARV